MSKHTLGLPGQQAFIPISSTPQLERSSNPQLIAKLQLATLAILQKLET
jgi:hypothetical protein